MSSGSVWRSAARASSTLSVQLTQLGAPSSAYKLVNVDPVTSVGASEVALKFLQAPINPADFNMAEGVYGVSRKLPAVGGLEGVAEVTKVGDSVKGLKEGDWVLPQGQIGTWIQSTKAVETDVIKICDKNAMPLPYAATIASNPCTSYRLLRDFADLKPGDVIIQNGANSMVGLGIIQMAREMGVKTINVIRSDRPATDKVCRLLTNLGGDLNITDSFLNTHSMREMVAELGTPKLAFNCTGGDAATNMCRVLGQGGTMVTYGGMARQPITVPFDLLAYKQLQLKGFWMTKWVENNSVEARSAMLADISKMIMDHKLTYFFEMHDMDDFQYALKQAQEPFHFRKVVLNIDFPDRLAEHDALPASAYEVFEAPLQ